MESRRPTAIGAGLFLALVFAAASPADAQQQGEWRSGFRLINIGIDATSEPIFDTDSTIAVDSAVSAEFDMTYMIGEAWAMEWMITAAPHDVSVASGLFHGLDMGSIWLTETTLTFQYVFNLWGPWRPYLGVGGALAYLITSDMTDAANAIGVDRLKADLSFGFVGQVGLAYRLNKKWILSLDLKWLDLPMDIRLDGEDGTIDTVETDLDPLIIGFGGAVRF